MELHMVCAPCPHRGASDLLSPACPQQGDHLQTKTKGQTHTLRLLPVHSQEQEVKMGELLRGPRTHKHLRRGIGFKI